MSSIPGRGGWGGGKHLHLSFPRPGWGLGSQQRACLQPEALSVTQMDANKLPEQGRQGISTAENGGRYLLLGTEHVPGTVPNTFHTLFPVIHSEPWEMGPAIIASSPQVVQLEGKLVFKARLLAPRVSRSYDKMRALSLRAPELQLFPRGSEGPRRCQATGQS